MSFSQLELKFLIEILEYQVFYAEFIELPSYDVDDVLNIGNSLKEKLVPLLESDC